MAQTSQDPAAVITYLDDWTKHLAGAGRTITSATVTADSSATVVSHSNTTTGVIFRLNVAGVTGVPANVTTTTTATLDNGDVDVRHHTIQVTST